MSPALPGTQAYLNSLFKDIIPEHGFLAKPSVLWPLDLIPKKPRIGMSETNPPPKPGNADTLKPSAERLSVAMSGRDIPKDGYPVETQEEMLEKYGPKGINVEADHMENRDGGQSGTSGLFGMYEGKWPEPPTVGCSRAEPPHMGEGSSTGSAFLSSMSETRVGRTSREGLQSGMSRRSEGVVKSREEVEDEWEPKPAKLLMENGISPPLEVRSQIQMYATNE